MAGPPDPFVLAADLVDPPVWEPAGRPPLEAHQVPPGGRWDLWLLEAGRGAGKTEACARYFAGYMRAHPGHRGRIIAPTFGDAVESCIQGPSGLVSIDPEVRWLPTAPGGAKVVWPNGSEALVLGTPFPRDVDRLRAGGNRHIDWWEEMAANVQLKKAWDQASLGLRLGDHPHAVASTTPRNRRPYREVRGLADTVLTHATIRDNPHLSAEWRAKQEDRYGGTRLGRQELDGRLLEDVEGALWRQEWIDRTRVPLFPPEAQRLASVVVGLDPADGTEHGAEQGIAVVGRALDLQLYVMQSEGLRDSALGFCKRAVDLAVAHKARIVVEKNHGGAYLVEVLELAMRELGVRVPYRVISASVGKLTRAEPVAALYEQGKVRHVGEHLELEEQLTTFDGTGESPDRLDALVWALTELMGYGDPGDSEGGAVAAWSDGHTATDPVAAWG